MKARLLTLSAVLGTALVSTVFADTYDDLRAKWRDVLTGGIYNPSDPDIALRLDEIDDVAQSYWGTLNISPTRTHLWSDLASTTNSSHMRMNFDRLKSMAVAYASPGSMLQGDATLLADIVSGLDWLYANRYNETTTAYDNWWDWEIGAPLALNDMTTLLYTQLTTTQRTNYMNAIEHFTPAVIQTGANRMWRCKVIAVRGILVKDTAKIAAARDGMGPIFDYVTSGDGFYRDGSFIQHSKVPYTGEYGRALVKDVIDMMYLLSGSSWAVTDSDRNNLYFWLHESYEPLVYRGECLDFVRGRSVSRYTQPSHFIGRSIVGAFIRATQFAPSPHLGYYKSAIKYWIQTDSTYAPSIYADLPIDAIVQAKAIVGDAGVVSRGELLGHFPYPSMDRVVHLRPGWGAGLSLHSTRIFNYESLNGENLKGWHTSDGMLYLYNGDLNQFSENFWPTVNPQRLPGTTLEAGSGASQSTASGASTVGGVESHGDVSGVAVMDLSPASRTLRGKKAWFLLDDEIVCLGAGITASGGVPLETIVENRRLTSAGTNAFTVDGATSLGTLQTAPGTATTLSGITRAHLVGNTTGADIGYYFPGGATLKGLREARSDTWNAINSYFPNPTSYTNNFLTLWFDHGVNPASASYSYVVLPNYSAATTATYASAPDVTILENSTSAQAVKDTTDGTVGAMFWGTTTKTVGTGADAITSSGKVAVLAKAASPRFYVTASDPSQSTGAPITLEFGRSATGVVGSDPGITVIQTSPTVKISIDFTGAKGATRRACFQLASNTQVIVDNTDAGFSTVGTWTTSTFMPNYYGTNYVNRATGAGANTARWTPNLPTAGTWMVYYRVPDGASNRATNAPLRIVFNGGEKIYRVNQQPVPGGSWVYLGIHNFAAGTSGYVELSDEANNTWVIADAVKFVR